MVWWMVGQMAGFELRAPQMEIHHVHGVRVVVLTGPFLVRAPAWTFQARWGWYAESGGIQEAVGAVRFADSLRTVEAHRLTLMMGRDTVFLFRDSVRYRDSTVALRTRCLVYAGTEARFIPVSMEVPDDHAWLEASRGWLVDGGVYAWGSPLPRLLVVTGSDTLRVQAGVIRVEPGRFYADSAAEVIHPAYRAWGTGLTYRTDTGEGVLLGDPGVLVYTGGRVEGRRIRFFLEEGRIREVHVAGESRLEQEGLQLEARSLVAWFAEDARVVRVEAQGTRGAWSGPQASFSPEEARRGGASGP